MVDPIYEQDRYAAYAAQDSGATTSASAKQASVQATQTVQAGASSGGAARSAGQDTVELSQTARALLQARSTQAAQAQSGAQAAQGGAPAQEAPAQAAVRQLTTQAAEAAESSGDDDTNLSGLTEQQISQLVSRGSITASQAATELAKRAAGKAQAEGSQAGNAVQSGLVLNAVA